MFGKIVNAVEVLVLVFTGVLVVVMLTYRPATPAASAGPTAANGQAIFAANCAECHGSRGQGDVGPRLAGGAVVAKYPNAADQVAVVTKGRGGMPAWSGRLTPAQIAAVVEYTRTKL